MSMDRRCREKIALQTLPIGDDQHSSYRSNSKSTYMGSQIHEYAPGREPGAVHRAHMKMRAIYTHQPCPHLWMRQRHIIWRSRVKMSWMKWIMVIVGSAASRPPLSLCMCMVDRARELNCGVWRQNDERNFIRIALTYKPIVQKHLLQCKCHR